ncbi:hypothetical protein BMETH_2717_0 [methanotrophic bacterial endosymbiont of Bathymodiolus sp.]|nr:hypothetical protein BMETH_2717_0 [methanotrophic bacterial endosymbiont of Bathymodiolus sp.]
MIFKTSTESLLATDLETVNSYVNLFEEKLTYIKSFVYKEC